MQMRKLGAQGPLVSLVGLGCNNFGGRLDARSSKDVIDHALELGITFFDCADVYGKRGGAETILGDTLGARRKQMVLATKFGIAMDDSGTKQGASRRYIVEAVGASLRRLRTDWIDVYIVHMPDPNTPIDETLRALEDLVAQGKVRFTGCSGFDSRQINEAKQAADSAGTRFFVCSLHQYSLLSREIESDIMQTIEANGLGLVPFFPLAGGMLTGKYDLNGPLPPGTRLTDTQDKRFINQTNLEKVALLKAFCNERGHSLLELAFSWLAGRPAMSSVIAGATSRQQLDANAKAVNWPLTPDDYQKIDEILNSVEAGG